MSRRLGTQPSSQFAIFEMVSRSSALPLVWLFLGSSRHFLDQTDEQEGRGRSEYPHKRVDQSAHLGDMCTKSQVARSTNRSRCNEGRGSGIVCRFTFFQPTKSAGLRGIQDVPGDIRKSFEHPALSNAGDCCLRRTRPRYCILLMVCISINWSSMGLLGYPLTQVPHQGTVPGLTRRWSFRHWVLMRPVHVAPGLGV